MHPCPRAALMTCTEALMRQPGHRFGHLQIFQILTGHGNLICNDDREHIVNRLNLGGGFTLN